MKNGIPYPKPEPPRTHHNASSNEAIVADFFCGSAPSRSPRNSVESGIGSDLGKFAIHTTRKRMIEVQRELKANNKDYRAFEILNLGKSERQHFIGVNPNLRDELKQKQLAEKEMNFVSLILSAYRAEPVAGFTTFPGKKKNRMVAVGPVNLPVTRHFAEEVTESAGRSTSPGRHPGLSSRWVSSPASRKAKQKGIDMALKYIPAKSSINGPLRRIRLSFTTFHTSKSGRTTRATPSPSSSLTSRHFTIRVLSKTQSQDSKMGG